MATQKQRDAELLKQLQAMVEATRPPLREITVDIDIQTPTPAETAIERMREMYVLMRAVAAEMEHAIAVVNDNYITLSQEDLVDLLYVLKQTSDHTDDIRKKIDAQFKTIVKVFVERKIKVAMSPGTYNGRFAKGQPHLKERSKVPAFNPNDADETAQYYQVCEWLGFPRDLQNRGRELYHEMDASTHVFDICYKGYNDLLEKIEIMGYALPEFIRKWDSFHEATVTLTPLNDLT